MQTVAMLNPVANRNMYDTGIPFAGKQVFGKDKRLQQGVRGKGYDFAAAQRIEEWDNGDPPDVMLWGEE